jgi:nucleotide-binding universal stress UspA family protein
MFKHVLIPTDGSKLSSKAVKKGVEFARLMNARITAIHVYPAYRGSPYGDFGPSDDVVEKQYREHAEEAAEKFLAEAVKLADGAGVRCDTVILEGDSPWEKIIAVAKKRKCDVIFMASHGRRGLAGLLMGSETHKVLTHTDIPVMVFR